MKNKFDEQLLIRLIKTTKISVDKIPLNDKEVIKMFSSCNNIIEGIDPFFNHCLSGINECSSNFYNNQIELVKPKNLSQISKLIAFSHSTGAWNNNACDLLVNHTTNLDEISATREDVYDYLIKYNVIESTAKEISLNVGINKLNLDSNKKMKKLLMKHQVPEWYITFLGKINYLPKRDIVEEITLLTYRLAWFKKNYTKEFYKSLFQTNNNRVLFKYKDTNSMEIINVISKLKNIIYEMKPNDYNSIEEYHKKLRTNNNKITLLIALLEIKDNENLMMEL